MITTQRILLSIAIVMIALSGRPAAAQRLDRSTPTMTYYSAFRAFYDGDYSDALKVFESESRSSIKNAQTRWIDSICYETMCGECYFQMGIFDKALWHYTAALQIFRTFPDWMTKVQFPPSIRIAGAGSRKAVPWGASTRQSQLGNYPSSMLIAQGNIAQNNTIQQGGVVQQANLFSITPQEIVRATVLALRRRATLLGPAAKFDPLTKDVLTAMSRPIGPPNHWSESWANLELGLAMAACGKESQANGYLERAVLAAGQFDHPLTSVALLELGKQALAMGQYPAAGRFFEEATYSAVNYPDYGILEEAFRGRALVHLLTNSKDYFAPLDAAIQWAKVKNLRQFRASLLLCAAENYAALGRPREAATMLDEARATIGRRNMSNGAIGARVAYLTSLVAFEQGRAAEGDTALKTAMGYMQHGSLWLFHIGLIDEMYVRGNVTPRSAMDLYADVLRDPRPVDWSFDPMESLATLLTPHPGPMEHWFAVALDRKDMTAAIEIAERAKRHRFLSSLEFGGRVESLRWLFEAPNERLPQSVLLQRQDLLARYPGYAKLLQHAQEIHATLALKPLVATDQSEFREQSVALDELGKLGLQQELLLREIAVRREPVSLVFPPVCELAEVQKSLPDKHAVLGFFVAGRRLYGYLLNNERSTLWQVGPLPPLVKQMQEMLRDMGNYQQNYELSAKELSGEKWRESAKLMLDMLLKGSQADFTQTFDELVILPDGILWYLPFEALQIKVDKHDVSLIDRFRVRYAPLLSLAVNGGWGRGPADNTAVVVGQLYPRDDQSVAQKAFDELAAVVPGAVALPEPPPAPSAIYSTLFRRLVVLDDIAVSEQSPYGWSPAPIDRGKVGSTLADWLLLPWGGPDVVVLPGFHTAAEDSLKKIRQNQPGDEVFLAACGLMANGARTVLMSRWRTGGQSGYDLAREFTQELSETSPADAWQRAVQVVTGSRLNLEAEPRLKIGATDETPKANHPFFWAGYMLVDCGTGPESIEQPTPATETPEPEEPAAEEKAQPEPDAKPEEKPEPQPDLKPEAEPEEKSDAAADAPSDTQPEEPPDAKEPEPATEEKKAE